MSNAPHLKYRSGNFTIATACSGVRTESPLLPELNDVLVYKQDFMQRADLFVALPYNSINLYAGVLDPAFLFDESEREDIGGGICKWTRSWCRVPNSYGKAGGTYPYVYPGYDGGRNAFRQLVAMEITRDFFLCGTGGVYASWQQIPVLRAFTVLDDAGDNSSILNPTTDQNTDKPYVLVNASGSEPGSLPSLATYQSIVADGGVLRVEDQKVTNFRGGIYMRETFTVPAL